MDSAKNIGKNQCVLIYTIDPLGRSAWALILNNTLNSNGVFFEFMLGNLSIFAHISSYTPHGWGHELFGRCDISQLPISSCRTALWFDNLNYNADHMSYCLSEICKPGLTQNLAWLGISATYLQFPLPYFVCTYILQITKECLNSFKLVRGSNFDSRERPGNTNKKLWPLPNCWSAGPKYNLFVHCATVHAGPEFPQRFMLLL